MTPKTLMAAVAVAAAGVAGAAGPTTMTVWQNGEQVATEAICNDSELTFGNQLSFFYAPQHEAVAFELTNETVITFFGRDGLQSALADNGAFSLRSNPVGEALEIVGPSGSSASVQIFAIHGARVANIPDWCGQPLNVAYLTPGVYILKINNQTIKFIKS